MLSFGDQWSAHYFKKEELECRTDFTEHSLFEITASLISTLVGLFQNLVFLFQIYEWKAMLYIIEAQKDRDVNEILYDLNNENLHDKDDSIKYRKKEMQMRQIFRIIFGFDVMFILVV